MVKLGASDRVVRINRDAGGPARNATVIFSNHLSGVLCFPLEQKNVLRLPYLSTKRVAHCSRGRLFPGARRRRVVDVLSPGIHGRGSTPMWSHFGESVKSPDVHWGYGVLTHSHMCFSRISKSCTRVPSRKLEGAW